MLHLAGYKVSLDDLKQFRQWGSLTPGHPEYGVTPGVDVSTGPLGHGFAMAVGLAMAEKMLAARYNKKGFPVVDHYTYGITRRRRPGWRVLLLKPLPLQGRWD